MGWIVATSAVNFHPSPVVSLRNMKVYLQRKRVFSCAHRYWNPNHEASWNAAYFGRLAEIHGHNYTVTATIAGEVDPVSGIVINLVDVKGWLAAAVSPFENRCVDAAADIMDGRQASGENIARILWERLQTSARGTPARLDSVRLAESDELWSEYRGEGDLVYVTKVYDFSAAHRLHAEDLSDEDNARVFGKCNRAGGHGHNYIIEITVKGAVDRETGFAYCLDRLDAIVDERVIQPMDHRNLNTDVPQFAHLNPTSENLAVVIWTALHPEVGPALHKVRVEETPRNAFEYLGE
ncbi:MAG TPA: 6-carboxytetrahydropterin synthase [Armatimonadota bacterium]|jgi:6-pyruvoyltetrahydropterin/6-carboxytetrahydropterin synthase